MANLLSRLHLVWGEQTKAWQHTHIPTLGVCDNLCDLMLSRWHCPENHQDSELSHQLTLNQSRSLAEYTSGMMLKRTNLYLFKMYIDRMQTKLVIFTLLVCFFAGCYAPFPRSDWRSVFNPFIEPWWCSVSKGMRWAFLAKNRKDSVTVPNKVCVGIFMFKIHLRPNH